MNRYFNYYNSLCTGANTPTIFTGDPYITAVKSMMADEIKHIVYYLEKLKDYNTDVSVYRDKVIEFISLILFNSDFKRESFFVIIEDLYKNKIKLKSQYTELCLQKGIDAEYFQGKEHNLSSKDEVLKLLNEREETVENPQKKITQDKKFLYSIIMTLVLNACNCLIELKNYGTESGEGKDAVFELINSINYPVKENSEIKKKITEFAGHNYKIMNKLYSVIIEKFGPVKKTKIPFSVKKGKAILVSGTSISDLKNILETVKDTDINVYTHNETFRAFKYEKFSEYKNLAGHYQVYGKNFREEFAAFPGPVYISVNSIPKIDVIRGQIYTGAKYPEFGIGRISDCDYSVLLSVAKKSPGFAEDKKRNPIKSGYEINEIKEKVSEILMLFNENKINDLIFIGITDMFNDENEYIKTFIKKAPETSYIISFSYFSERKNFWHAAESFDFSMMYLIIELLRKEKTDITKNTDIIFSDCNINTLSHIFNFLYLKVKNIYLGPCCPNIINPTIIKGLEKEFGILPLTEPENDLSEITGNSV